MKTRCKHFNGIQYETCLVGVRYLDVRDELRPALQNFPCRCLDVTTCSKREMMTKEELDEELASFVQAIQRADEARAKGLCPECGKSIEPRVRQGRCEYGACGHRLGQVG